MSIVVANLIRNSLYEIGYLAPGEPGSAADLNFCLSKLNRMISQWSTRSVYIFTTAINRYTLTPSQTSYTIGRGTPAADFVADRPLGSGPGKGIKNANIVLTTVSPEVRVPLAIWNDDQWASVSVKDIPTTLPIALYNDGAYPNSNLYLWGYPTQANDLELFTEQQLTEFADINATFDSPPGYEEAVTLSLAESGCAAFGQTLSNELRTQAAKARSAIQSLNTAPPLMGTNDGGIPDSGNGETGFFLYRTGLTYPGYR